MKDLSRRGFLKATLAALGLSKAQSISRALGAASAASSSANDRSTTMASPQSTHEFFDSQKRLTDYYAAHPPRLSLKATTAAEFKTWAAAARAKFIELTGFDRMTAAKPNPRQAGTEDCGDFLREYWLIDTEPDMTMPFYLLRPKNLAGPAAAVICCHGHGAGKDAIAGVVSDPYGAFGVQYAKAGMLAFCPDARGFGQRREYDARKTAGQSSCTYLQSVGLPLGIAVVGTHAFDLARLIDYVQSRQDVRPDRIGCVGFSGGGWQALALGAVDDRPACTVISGYMHPVAAPLLFHKHMCPCNMVPHLWEELDLGDLAALIAPRPLLIQVGDSDNLSGPKGVADVQPQVDIARKAYQLLGCKDRLEFYVFSGGHEWNGTKAVPWVHKQLLG
jgi:dienelactone hydrolase